MNDVPITMEKIYEIMGKLYLSWQMRLEEAGQLQQKLVAETARSNRLEVAAVEYQREATNLRALVASPPEPPKTTRKK